MDIQQPGAGGGSDFLLHVKPPQPQGDPPRRLSAGSLESSTTGCPPPPAPLRRYRPFIFWLTLGCTCILCFVLTFTALQKEFLCSSHSRIASIFSCYFTIFSTIFHYMLREILDLEMKSFVGPSVNSPIKSFPLHLLLDTIPIE